MGEYKKQHFDYFEQGNMGVFIGQGDHDYCGVPRKSSEQRNKFSVQNCEGFKQVEVKTANISIIFYYIQFKNISNICLESGKPDIDLFESRVSHQVTVYMSQT